MAAPYRSVVPAWAGLPKRFQAELVLELEPGERVVWIGMPSPTRLFSRAIRALPLPILWNGVALTLLAATASVQGLLWLTAVPLLAIGVPLFHAPMSFLRAKRASFYALTDRRALVFEPDEVVTLPASRIVAVVANEQRGGVGDLVFVTKRRERRTLWGIARVREVEAVAREHLLA